MSLNQRITTEFSPCTPSAPQFRDLSIQTFRPGGSLSTVSERAELEQVRSGDQRVSAAGLSIGQDLAGNACVTFSMFGDLERAIASYDDSGYRYTHFEAGAIGHRLYLGAEALGLSATGIGAFYDDELHRHLNLIPEQGLVVYHFAIGYPVPNPRLSASNQPQEIIR
jgi:nitroreductase